MDAPAGRIASFPSVAIIVLTWNNAGDTLECLKSLEELDYPRYHVILVDNGSTDTTVVTVRENFPGVHIIENGTNVGYAEGNNVGLRHALDYGFSYALVLNNDTLLASDCLSVLVDDLSVHADAAAAAPKSFYFDQADILYFAGGLIENNGRLVHVGIGRKDGPEYAVACETQWLTGCAILFRCEDLLRIGLFDSKFFLLFEDVDWSLRARKAGCRLRFVPEAKLWHKVSSAFGTTWSLSYLYYYCRNSLLCVERNFAFHQKPNGYFSALRRAFEEAANQARPMKLRDKTRVWRAILQGISDYLFRRFGKRSSP